MHWQWNQTTGWDSTRWVSYLCKRLHGWGRGRGGVPLWNQIEGWGPGHQNKRLEHPQPAVQQKHLGGSLTILDKDVMKRIQAWWRRADEERKERRRNWTQREELHRTVSASWVWMSGKGWGLNLDCWVRGLWHSQRGRVGGDNLHRERGGGAIQGERGMCLSGDRHYKYFFIIHRWDVQVTTCLYLERETKKRQQPSSHPVASSLPFDCKKNNILMSVEITGLLCHHIWIFEIWNIVNNVTHISHPVNGKFSLLYRKKGQINTSSKNTKCFFRNNFTQKSQVV